MPTTQAGWFLFGAILVAAGCTAWTATRLLMSVLGAAERDWRNIPAAYAFGSLLMIATLLFVYVEPRP